MPPERSDSWKDRLTQCFEEARVKSQAGQLGITTSYAQGDLLAFCRNYSSGKSVLLARVPPPAITFFVIGLLAEIKNQRAAAVRKPADSAPGRTLHAKTG